MSVATYSEFKYSGFEWLGDIPASWSIVPLRYLTECCDGQRIPLNATQRAEKPGLVPYWGANQIMGFVNEAIFDETLILLGEDGAPFFDKTRSVAFLTEGPVWPNNHIHVLRPILIEGAAFIAYALNATDYAAFIDGSTRDKLTQGDMNGIPIPGPPIAEQIAIARFLNLETGKIDALVEEQRRLIALLKEKRQAVISHAVTKGLDPNAPMTESGVEWLGEVPTHWEVMPLRWLYRFVKRQDNAGGEVLSVYRDFGVIQKSSRSDNNNKTPEDLSKYQSVYSNDLVINKMKSWQGSLGVSKLFGVTSPDYAVFEPIHSENSEYLNLLLRCSMLPDVYRSISNGIRTDQWRLEPEKLRTIGVPVPPAAEQSAIVLKMAAMTEEFDKLEQVALSAIELFQERRAALVSAAVTGKIDVRGIATQLVDVA